MFQSFAPWLPSSRADFCLLAIMSPLNKASISLRFESSSLTGRRLLGLLDLPLTVNNLVFSIDQVRQRSDPSLRSDILLMGLVLSILLSRHIINDSTYLGSVLATFSKAIFSEQEMTIIVACWTGSLTKGHIFGTNAILSGSAVLLSTAIFKKGHLLFL